MKCFESMLRVIWAQRVWQNLFSLLNTGIYRLREYVFVVKGSSEKGLDISILIIFKKYSKNKDKRGGKMNFFLTTTCSSLMRRRWRWGVNDAGFPSQGIDGCSGDGASVGFRSHCSPSPIWRWSARRAAYTSFSSLLSLPSSSARKPPAGKAATSPSAPTTSPRTTISPTYPDSSTSITSISHRTTPTSRT